MIQSRYCVLMVCLACGGSDTPAKNASSGDCPAGMVKQGGDCVAPEGQSGPGKTDTTTTSTGTGSTGTGSTGTGSSGTGTGSAGTDSAPTGGTPYDKDAVEIVLRRAANQVKGNCGAATDENGKANGPWGTTKASVRLGRNGHVRGVTVPERYSGKPVGDCVVHAFQNLIFPPYAASADVVVEWDIEIVRPAGL
jgi:hypothetical protein